jgi:para-nitrobenzyl esterase
MSRDLPSCPPFLFGLLLWSCSSNSPAITGDLDASTHSGEGIVDVRRGERAVVDAAACPVGAPAEENVVASERGLLRGVKSGETIAFLGVPYAAPPVGARRFAPPEPRACWTGVRDASQYGNRCPQHSAVGAYLGDEDCLFLNVWTPALPTVGSASLPVLVFLHGGANVMGGGNEGAVSIFGSAAAGVGNIYDGHALAAGQRVVVVTLNYRLGALGFLAHPALSQQGARGNYALLDAIAALAWVQRNIRAFGGDPGRVLLFGESAGAAHTCMLLVSPAAKGLFHAALMESGSCRALPLAEREAGGAQLAEQWGCASAADVATCLRQLPATTLVGQLGEKSSFLVLGEDLLRVWDLQFGATIDGTLIPADPLARLRDGKHNKVPFVVGTNADESALFAITKTTLTCSAYAAELALRFGADADRLLELYPCSNSLFVGWPVVELSTDAVFTCPARRIARAAASGQSQPVHRYLFTHSYSNSPLTALRAFHASDLPFVFQTFSAAAYLPTKDELELSAAIQGYWARLAGAGDPNAAAAPSWPKVDAQGDPLLILDTTIAAQSGYHTERCDFWDTLAK